MRLFLFHIPFAIKQQQVQPGYKTKSLQIHKITFITIAARAATQKIVKIANYSFQIQETIQLSSPFLLKQSENDNQRSTSHNAHNHLRKSYQNPSKKENNKQSRIVYQYSFVQTRQNLARYGTFRKKQTKKAKQRPTFVRVAKIIARNNRRKSIKFNFNIDNFKKI